MVARGQETEEHCVLSPSASRIMAEHHSKAPADYWLAFYGLDVPDNPPVGYKPHVRSVYVLTAGPAVKVGIARNVAMRVRGIQTGNADPVCIFWAVTMTIDDARVAERLAHQELRKMPGVAATGEWFYCHPQQAVTAIKRVAIRERFACKRDLVYDFDRGFIEDGLDEGFYRMCSYF